VQPDLSLTVPSDPRAEAHGKDVELVVVLEGDSLALYLDDFATNAPLDRADVRVESLTPDGPREDVAVLDEDAVYRLEAPWLAAPGRHDLLISIQDDRRFDLLTARLDVPLPDALTPALDPARSTMPWLDIGIWALVFAVGLLAGAWVNRGMGSRRRPSDARLDPSHQEVPHAR
jgi:hypothetical protein